MSSLTESQSFLALITQPSSQTVQAGIPVTLKCSAQSNKKITYEWKHNNNTIQTDKEPRITIRDDGSLRISKTELDDNGIYRCIASTRRGSKKGRIVRKSRFARLTVEGMCDEATILTRPTHMTKFPVGTELSLRCRCRSSKTGTVRWIKNGATVRPVNGRISLDHRKLVINSTSFADSGNYTCYVTIDKLGTAKSNKLEIWVGNKPKMLVHPADHLHAVKGQTMFVNCLATGIPTPVDYWYYVGPVWSQHVKHSIRNNSKYAIYSNGTLVIRNLQTKDMGVYECEARNVMGSTSKQFKIYTPITFITKPKNKTVVMGKTAVLRCNASGVPQPKIDWMKIHGRIDKKRTRQLANGNLFIRDALMSDAGQYACIATTLEELKEIKVTLEVVESDVIKLSLSHKHRIEAFLGARRKITCDFHGSPPITVTWTKKGLDKLPSRVENHGASLLIKKVALSDAGQYICNASNAFSSGTSYVNVSVYDPLRFLVEPNNNTATVGDSVWFHCVATGSPKPRITWLKHGQGGRPLDEEKYKAHENGSLNIRDVQLSDAGSYFCIAATNVDLKQITVHLEVKGKPVWLN
ncbi:roundabout homolog 1-like isoform X2 [Orbicella faveolata]|uniref:roundabout homolog 1-like isoform X2 n=1 Tax=Orbicella faveolata TaxID=48498 RepID=UPI0009E55272|nr:roundabout homolog 1-like isoform X2 [Orbicella faveolata]